MTAGGKVAVTTSVGKLLVLRRRENFLSHRHDMGSPASRPSNASTIPASFADLIKTCRLAAGLCWLRQCAPGAGAADAESATRRSGELRSASCGGRLDANISDPSLSDPSLSNPLLDVSDRGHGSGSRRFSPQSIWKNRDPGPEGGGAMDRRSEESRPAGRPLSGRCRYGVVQVVGIDRGGIGRGILVDGGDATQGVAVGRVGQLHEDSKTHVDFDAFAHAGRLVAFTLPLADGGVGYSQLAAKDLLGLFEPEPDEPKVVARQRCRRKDQYLQAPPLKGVRVVVGHPLAADFPHRNVPEGDRKPQRTVDELGLGFAARGVPRLGTSMTVITKTSS